MILAGPGVEAKGISPAFAFVTDLVPTILELTGTRDATPPGKHPIDGRSLTPALRDPSGLIHPPQEVNGLRDRGPRRRLQGRPQARPGRCSGRRRPLAPLRSRGGPGRDARPGHSIAIDDVDGNAYDIVFLAGGWGAAYDLGQSKDLGRKVSEAYARESVVGGVCHGPLGLLQAVTPAGEPLVRGRRISAVSDKQIEELDITFTPMHPERDLRAAGALFESDTRFRDMFASRVAVDGRLVTGQNQNSGAETAHRMMEILLESRRAGTAH